MTRLRKHAAAGLMAAGLALTPLAGHAQSSAAAPAEAASWSFDGYRVLAVTAGVVGGAAAAVLVTDGLIIPAYAWATGGPAAGWSVTSGMAAGAGAGAGEIAASHGFTNSMYGPLANGGYEAVRNAMTLLGAIGGGFYADSWYMNE